MRYHRVDELTQKVWVAFTVWYHWGPGTSDILLQTWTVRYHLKEQQLAHKVTTVISLQITFIETNVKFSMIDDETLIFFKSLVNQSTSFEFCLSDISYKNLHWSKKQQQYTSSQLLSFLVLVLFSFRKRGADHCIGEHGKGIMIFVSIRLIKGTDEKKRNRK